MNSFRSQFFIGSPRKQKENFLINWIQPASPDGWGRRASADIYEKRICFCIIFDCEKGVSLAQWFASNPATAEGVVSQFLYLWKAGNEDINSRRVGNSLSDFLIYEISFLNSEKNLPEWKWIFKIFSMLRINISLLFIRLPPHARALDTNRMIKNLKCKHVYSMMLLVLRIVISFEDSRGAEIN